MNDDRRLVPLNDIAEDRVVWLWANRVALGALTLLDGDPGCGKSTVCTT